jgi:hypothetical protein
MGRNDEEGIGEWREKVSKKNMKSREILKVKGEL